MWWEIKKKNNVTGNKTWNTKKKIDKDEIKEKEIVMNYILTEVWVETYF